MNEFKIKRKTYTNKSTIGELSYNGVFICYTLEDKTRKLNEAKVYGKTAIPAGRYQLIIDHSNAFHKDMPHILDVPGFEGVRLHAGNTEIDSLGCPLLGLNKGADSIWGCADAVKKFTNLLVKALAQGKVFIVVEDTAH